MATRHENKFTVHTRLTNLENRCSQTESALPVVEMRLKTDLQHWANERFHGAPGKDGKDGRDCQCREVKGEKGDKGDVTLVGDAEVQAALVKLRAQKAQAQAAFLLAVSENAKRPHSGLKRVLAAVLDGLKRDSGGYI